MSIKTLYRGLWIAVLLAGSVVSMSAQHHRDTLTVYFRLGSSELDLDYRENRDRCISFVRNVENLKNAYSDNGLVSVKVDFYASASPDGPLCLNERLARDRMKVLFDYLHDELKLADAVIGGVNFSEDWEGLHRMVEADKDVPYRDEVIKIIFAGEDTWKDPDGEKEKALKRLHGGKTYRYLVRNMLPDLRVVNVHLHADVDPLLLSLEKVTPVAAKALKAPEKKMPVPPAAPETEPGFTRYLTLKTNFLGWSLIGMNIAAEYDFAPHFSVALPFYYSGGLDYFTSTLKFRGIVLQPEFRWFPWLSENDNEGFYLGAHFGLGWYNFALDGNYRIQDVDGNTPSFGGGLGVGYQMPLKRNPRWGLEFALGAGVYRSRYDMFYNEGNGPYYKRDVHKTWFGIDNAAVSITYKFDLKNKGGKK